MTEMGWQHLFFEFLDVNDDEISSFFVPADDILVDVVLNRKMSYFEDLVSFGDENWGT